MNRPPLDSEQEKFFRFGLNYDLPRPVTVRTAPTSTLRPDRELPGSSSWETS
ncbi:hypothetical protein CROQUDRAFT_109082 [Cronartium quercuum f. sp. fusiforme G11]|uniref:Uncharacterized protein n=1 Tax=Cronartium quercuum f. sp. fusiforme G11 TaxID=708437 RepID=A0A9P6NHB5_9BASI|nr:hypothetical protein CROQUDRAFT_109082 [Cronartium quercuum f. sp. fusiforme G11]